ncbi:MAG: RNA polymerase sigma factor [Planctomycetes bacterium]|nr:RNA polymerase sigma factor [Planctomycetota bacterium]
MHIAVRPSRWLGLNELRPTLRAFLRRHCRDGGEVEDVLQETLLRAARYRGTLADPRTLRGWTQRIAVNVLRDRMRRARRQKRFENGEEFLDLAEGRETIPGECAEDVQLRVGSMVIDRQVALAQLADVFGELKPADRAVLRSYYTGEQSCARTAGECAIPTGLVKVRLFRARQRLLRALRRRLATLPDSEREWCQAFGDGLAGVA